MDRPFEHKSDDSLIESKEALIAHLTAGKGNSLDEVINNLLDIERELTLRENQ